MRVGTIGSFYALSAAFWGALYLIPYKSLGAVVAKPSAVWAMLLASAVLNTMILLARRRGKRPQIDRLAVAVGLLLAACTVTGNIAMALSLGHVEPAITSVVLQTQIIFVAIGELLFLRIRLSKPVIIGGCLSLAGFILMQPPGSTSAETASLIGGFWAIIAALSFAAMLLITKAVIHRVDVISLNMLRLWFAVGLLALWPGAIQGISAMSPWLWFLAIAAAATGPTLGRLHLMQAVRHISASQAKLLVLASPPFALILGWLAFASVPSVRESIGGMIILAGVALPLLQLWRSRRDHLAQPRLHG